MNINFSRFTLVILVCLSTIATAYGQKKLLILGSSTSACWGPSNPANCYVNRLAAYYNTPTPMITIDNRAAAGFNVYKSMPRWYKPAAGRDTALAYYSITDAIAANPHVILVNYPTNNYDVYSVSEVLQCLRIIKGEASKAGIPCYITTTQPRTSYDANGREKLRILKDSILYQFGNAAIDFWTGVADPVTLGIAAGYQVTGDPVHLNDDAHNVLYQRVLAKNIFNAMLPDAGMDQLITLPSGTLLDGRNSVSPGKIISYNWSKLTGPASFNLVTPAASSTTVNALAAGVYSFRLTIKDDRGYTSSDDVIVNVKDGVAPVPVAQAGADINMTLPVNSGILDGSKSGAPGSTITNFSWTYVSGPAGYNMLTPASSTTTVNGLVQGTYTFRLTVTNASGLTAYDDVSITVNPAAGVQQPVANAGTDETIPVGQATVLKGEKSTAPAGIKTYSWKKYSGPAALEMLTPAASSTWIRNMTAGTYVFRLTITDSSGASAFDDVNIIVTGSSPVVAPSPTAVAQAGADQTITLPVTAVSLNASSSTAPGGYITSYKWSYVTGPSGYYIATPGNVTTEVKNLTEGTYTFRLTITNNVGVSSYDDVIITVRRALSNAPIANAGKDETVPVGQATVLHGESSSAAAGIKSYQWTKITGPATFEILSPSASYTWIRNLEAGTFVFRLTVTDNNGATAYDDVVITVTALNLPVAVAGRDINIVVPASSVLLDGRQSATPQGTISSYNWKYISGPSGASIISPDSAITKVTGLVPGVYTFRLTVTNSLGNKGYDDIIVSVSSATLISPTTSLLANAGKDETIPLGQATVLHGENSTTTSGIISSYVWTKYSGPARYEMLTPNAASTWIRNMETGTYIYRLTVTDDKGVKATDDVMITVTAATILMNRNKLSNLDVAKRQQIPDQPGVRLYPNPVIHYLNLQVNDREVGAGKIFIMDASGSIVKVVSIIKDQQVLSRQLDLSGLKQGNYTIEVAIGNKSIVAGTVFKY